MIMRRESQTTKFRGLSMATNDGTVIESIDKSFARGV
jgi:hypothetical protein